MERVLRGSSFKICFVYLDDLIEEHLENLAQVISYIKADLKLHPKKCDLFKGKVSFLGHIVSADGVATDHAKLEAVLNWPVPKKEVVDQVM